MIREFPARWWRHYRNRAAYSPSTLAVDPPEGLAGWVDAVAAIAATLLVLELHIPPHRPGRLGSALAGEPQHYAAYALGYVLVALGWLNTRRLLRFLHGVDYYLSGMVLLVNGAWTLTPFAIAVLAGAGHNSGDLAAAVRLLTGILTASMLIWSCAATYASRRALWDPRLDAVTRQLWVPGCQMVWTLPLAGFALSYASPYAGLACVGLYVLIAAMPVPGRVAQDDGARGVSSRSQSLGRSSAPS